MSSYYYFIKQYDLIPTCITEFGLKLLNPSSIVILFINVNTTFIYIIHHSCWVIVLAKDRLHLQS